MSSKTIVVCSETEALNAITQWPDKVFSFQKKKDAKAYKGSMFLNNVWAIKSQTDTNQGWFSFENATICQSITDIKNVQEGSAEEFEGVRLQVKCKKSQMGPIGEFLCAFEPIWQKTVDAACADGTITKTKKMDVHNIVQLVNSEKHKTAPGQPCADPVIRFKIDFDKYSPNVPQAILKGQPKTSIYDYKKPYVVKTPKGNVQKYELATLEEDGKQVPVNAENIHKFITEGSKIIKGRFSMPSTCVSAAWISAAMIAHELVIDSIAGEGFSDEIIVDEMIKPLGGDELADFLG